jgi:hypothetical protein
MACPTQVVGLSPAMAPLDQAGSDAQLDVGCVSPPREAGIQDLGDASVPDLVDIECGRGEAERTGILALRELAAIMSSLPDALDVKKQSGITKCVHVEGKHQQLTLNDFERLGYKVEEVADQHFCLVSNISGIRKEA